MLKSVIRQNRHNNENPSMTEQTLNQQKPLETLIALDIGFSCLLENIKNTQPVLARSLAIDMQHIATQIPTRLPANTQNVEDILNIWASVLNTPPTKPTPGQQN